MDELQMVQDFFGEPSPPDPDMTAAAKARMSAGGPAVRRRSTRRSPAAWPRGLPLRLGIPAVAVVAAAAVAVVVAVQGPVVRKPPPLSREADGIGVFQLPGGAAVGGSAGSGREILLTAARAVAKAAQPSAPERYYVTSENVGNFLRVGPPGNRYLVLDVNNHQYWAATNPRDGSPDIFQARYVQAASPADEAAWRRDGSPRVWNDVTPIWTLRDPVAGELETGPLSAAPGKMFVLGAGYGLQPFLVGNQAFSLRQLRALPADRAKLKALLLTGWTGYGGVAAATYYLLEAVPAVLEMPVTPAVRSALYQLLASLSGVQSIGTVTDVGGQQGVAVSYTARNSECGYQGGPKRSYIDGRPLFSSCTIQQILIIDPDDGMPLAEELRYTQLPAGQNWSAPDGLFSYEVFGTPYWTNNDRPFAQNRP